MKTKKELKEEYKSMKFRAGVFQIRNSVNGKIFIDNSANLDKIWNRHYAELKSGQHRNEAMQKDWNEFGEDKFVYEILSEIDQKDGQTTNYAKEADQLAKMFIEELQPFGRRGYNIVSRLNDPLNLYPAACFPDSMK